MHPRGYAHAKRARTTSFNNASETSRNHCADEVVGPEKQKRSPPRRWSSEEDERLRASVEKHQGTNWKKIAKEVESRNHVQCLQRWTKVLAPGLTKGQWKPAEDQLLVSAVNDGYENWGSLSTRIPGRTSKQCRERWCQHLDPRIGKSQWTAGEDDIIVTLQKRIGNKWAQIARHLDGRTENAVKIRWKVLERKLKREGDEREQQTPPRGPPSRQNTDTRLPCLAAQAVTSASKTSNPEVEVPRDPVAVRRDHAQSFNDTIGLPKPLPSADPKGKRVASITGNLRGGYIQRPPSSAVGLEERARSGGNGQDRHNGGRRGWFVEEDERLKEAVEELGEKKWREVARHVHTRNHIQCQQRWKKALRPGLVKGAWNDEEDKELVARIGQGFSNWSALAAGMRRTSKQCRERWAHHLDPSLRHGSWTPMEDQLLIALEARLGKKWAAIAKEIPGRTEHAVKGRFKTLSRELDLDRLAGGQARRPGRGSVDRQSASPKHVRKVDSGLGAGINGKETAVPMASMAPTAPSTNGTFSTGASRQTQPESGKKRTLQGAAGHRAPVLPPLGIGVGSLKTSAPLCNSAPPCNGNGAIGSAAAGGRDVMEEARGSASATGAGEFMEQSTRWQHQVRPQQQRQLNVQQMLNLNIAAQRPTTTMTPPSAALAAMAALAPNSTGANDGDEASIARLLSVGSVKTDPSLSRLLYNSSVKTEPSLSDVISGFCGHCRNTDTSSSSIISDVSRLARKQSDWEPTWPVAEVGTEESPQKLAFHKMSPLVSDGHTSESVGVGEGSSLGNEQEYSDLASILMDGGFDACKDGVEPKSEAVTLGEDSFRNYALSADDGIIMGYLPVESPRTSQGPGPPQHIAEQHHASFNGPLKDVEGVSSDWIDILPASLFNREAADDPSDPYYF